MCPAGSGDELSGPLGRQSAGLHRLVEECVVALDLIGVCVGELSESGVEAIAPAG